MIEFPETAQSEWEAIAKAANTEAEIRAKIEHDTLVERAVERLRQNHEAKVIFQQELDAEQTPTLEMMTGDEYLNSPNITPPSDLIDGVVKENGLCIVLGPSGSGKTTIALQMLHSVSTGSDWLGQQATNLPGSMGIVSYDQDAAISFDWLSNSGIDMSKVSIVNAYKRGNPLGVAEMRKAIAEDWKKRNVEVVVIDSFSASFFGSDQNDAAATMAHYRDLKLFALTEVGAKALLVIAHSSPGAQSKARGSTVHHDVADSIVAVEKNEKNEERTVRMVKYRAAGGQHQMNPVIVTAPDQVTHLVSIDPGAMTLAGMDIPAAVRDDLFPPMPDNIEDPDISDVEEDDL